MVSLISPAITWPLELSALALQNLQNGRTRSNNNPKHKPGPLLGYSNYGVAKRFYDFAMSIDVAFRTRFQDTRPTFADNRIFSSS